MAKPETLTQAAIKRLLPKPAAKIADRWYKTNTADYIVVSFPKSGRTWLRVMFSMYFTRMYGFTEYETLGFENLHKKNPLIPKIYFTHDDSYKARPAELEKDKSAYRKHKVIYLVRDPRDVIVSLYFHRTRRDKDLDMPLMDFVLGEQGGLRTVIEFYNIWAANLSGIAATLMVKYEELRAEPVPVLQRLIDFIGQEVNESLIREVVEETSFRRMKEKERSGSYDRGMLHAGDRDDDDSYKVRRGKVGGYADYFSTAEMAEIDGIIERELAPLYGY